MFREKYVFGIKNVIKLRETIKDIRRYIRNLNFAYSFIHSFILQESYLLFCFGEFISYLQNKNKNDSNNSYV